MYLTITDNKARLAKHLIIVEDNDLLSSLPFQMEEVGFIAYSSEERDVIVGMIEGLGVSYSIENVTYSNKIMEMARDGHYESREEALKDLNITSIEEYKIKKINELNEICNKTVLSGFTSDALGSDHFYDFDYEAQTNLGGMLNAIVSGIISGNIIWKASGIPQSHTIEQFKKLFSDGLIHKNNNIGKYWMLKEQILNLEKIEEIDSIDW